MNATSYIAQFVGINHHVFEELPSTNTYAISFASKNKPPHGTVITAYHQVAGRGQYGSTWNSSANENIASSIILYPKNLPANRQFDLSKAIAIAVRDVVAYYLPDRTISVKWPNDIYIDDKKVCGILIQNILSGKFINTAIVGIGININQSAFSENLPNPTSIFLEKGATINVEEARQLLFNSIEFWYQLLDNNTMTPIHQYYYQYLYRRGISSSFIVTATDEQFTGVITGVDHIGQLTIEENGKIRRFDFKEVRIIA